ncbi:MAG: hypothetical protein HZB33_01715 [Nitrospirae bacterium]|nr:hypothetical protein [Nitrospirota bacterium]
MDDDGDVVFTSERARAFARNVLGTLLVLAVLAEGYYIFKLRDMIDKQSDELRGASMQLQSLKNAQSSLREELESARKKSGDTNEGTTPNR